VSGAPGDKPAAEAGPAAGAAEAGGPLARFSAWVDDALNPIVVKELRQAVHGRFVGAILLLFLLVSLVTMSIFLLSQSGSADTQTGSEALLWLQGIVVGTCLLFLPLYAGARLAAERSDTNVDLLFITTIPTRAIIRGKLLVTAIIAGLIYSACMPFMTLTFLLRGVDLPSIVLVLAAGFLAVVGSIQLGILLSSLTLHRGMRFLLGLGLIVGLCFIFGFTIRGSYTIIETGLGSLVDEPRFWGVAGTIVGLWAAAVFLLYVWSVALIKPPSSNRALPVRLAMTGVWVFGSVLALVWMWIENYQDILIAWCLASVELFTAGVVIGACERDTLGPRIRRTIPRFPHLRLPGFLFYSGAAGGIAWALSLGAVALFAVAAGAAAFGVGSGSFDDAFEGSIILALCAYAYSLTGVLLRRRFFSPDFPTARTWILILAVAVLSTVVPLLGAVFVHGPDRFHEEEWWLLFGPFVIEEEIFRVPAMTVLGAWSVIATLLNGRWFLRQFREFQPPELMPTVAAPAAAPAVLAPGAAAAGSRAEEDAGAGGKR
jgi:hypothetical protein